MARKWRVAKALEKLLSQLNKAYPHRSKDSDGGIGNAEHATRSSDHNPWIFDPNEIGVVSARDFTHDPANGLDSYKLAEVLRASGDKRIKYIISNRRISNPLVDKGAWRPYKGSNPHDHHVHVSVMSTQNLYDSEAEWKITEAKGQPVSEMTPTSPGMPPQAPEKAQDTFKPKGGTGVAQVYVYCMYGLGGRIWSAAIEDLVATTLRRIPNTTIPSTRGYTQWRSIVEEIKKQPPGSKTVVLGHSMGASAATYVTDYVHVDLVVSYDAAGQACSGIGKNCGKLFDFQDTALAMVPKFRPWAYPGNENKIENVKVALGHTRCPLSSVLLAKVVSSVKGL